LRKFALLASGFVVLLFAGFAEAQQIDFAVGASGLFSSNYGKSASQAYLPATEKGGIYPSLSADFIFKNRFGFNGEVAVRDKQGLYNGYQDFRPVFYDANALFAPRFGKKVSADFMAGVGAESVIFYNQFATCYGYSAGCPTFVSSNHLMGHLSAGVRYYFWRNAFVRPEAHLYLIRNNFEFSSNKVGRLGVSIGYSFNRE
jgi:hypothetical protein